MRNASTVVCGLVLAAALLSAAPARADHETDIVGFADRGYKHAEWVCTAVIPGALFLVIESCRMTTLDHDATEEVVGEGVPVLYTGVAAATGVAFDFFMSQEEEVCMSGWGFVGINYFTFEECEIVSSPLESTN